MLAALAAACSKPTAIAKLVEADGGVEREEGGQSGRWSEASVGTHYFIGDAARTANSPATLEVGSAARIVMQGKTTLRFRGSPGKTSIIVEDGAIDLTNTSSYTLDVSDAKLAPNRSRRITSKDGGKSTIVLTVSDGAPPVKASEPIDLVVADAIDAGVRDAAADAAVVIDADAGTQPVSPASIEVTGRKAEIRAPGATAWKPLPAGTAPLASGSAVRLGAATSARLVVDGTTLQLAGGSRIRLDPAQGVVLELGVATASATAPSTVSLPGGAIGLEGSVAAPADARLDTNGRETTVAMLRGEAKLTGAQGADHPLRPGETASLTQGGAIRVIDVIPSYFDLRIVAGESSTIHDPRPPTAVQFQFDGRCPGGGTIEVGGSPQLRTVKISSGRDFANMMLGAGTVFYRLRCTVGEAAASGRITVRRDDGRRPLPKNQGGINDIDADGRNYRISYQSIIPSVAVHVRGAGARHTLHLASGGKEQTFDSSGAAITVPGGQLHEGTYTYWVDRDGVRQDKISTLTIDFDQTAPQVYIESPNNGQPWADDIDVRGAVLPGWTAAVDAITIPVDAQRRFAAKVGIPGANALAIRLSHARLGVHYYLRRQR